MGLNLATPKGFFLCIVLIIRAGRIADNLYLGGKCTLADGKGIHKSMFVWTKDLAIQHEEHETGQQRRKCLTSAAMRSLRDKANASTHAQEARDSVWAGVVSHAKDLASQEKNLKILRE
jgi:hypothetical protein